VGPTDDDLRIRSATARDLYLGAANDHLIIKTTTGNVGIGTTTPSSKLEVHSAAGALATFSGTISGQYVQLRNYATNPTWGFEFLEGSTARAYITRTSDSRLSFWAGDGSTEDLVILDSGNVGIGTTSPYAKLSVAGSSHLGGDLVATGTVKLSGLPISTTGNYVCIDTTTNQITSGTTCTLSSTRFKNNIQDLDLGLSTVLALNPITFQFKQGYGDNGATTQLGFVAEQADAIDPRLVPHDENGLPSGFNYQNYTAVLTKAIQELNAKITASTTPQNTSLLSSLKEWVGDKITATLGIFQTVETKKLCVEDICVTREEFKKILLQANVTETVPDPIPVPSSTPAPTLPEPIASTTPETTPTPEPEPIVIPEVIPEPESALLSETIEIIP
jgi:hypothetical protein